MQDYQAHIGIERTKTIQDAIFSLHRHIQNGGTGSFSLSNGTSIEGIINIHNIAGHRGYRAFANTSVPVITKNGDVINEVEVSIHDIVTVAKTGLDLVEPDRRDVVAEKITTAILSDKEAEYQSLLDRAGSIMGQRVRAYVRDHVLARYHSFVSLARWAKEAEEQVTAIMTNDLPRAIASKPLA